MVATGVLFATLFHVGVKEDSTHLPQRYPEINGGSRIETPALESPEPTEYGAPNEKTSLLSSTETLPAPGILKIHRSRMFLDERDVFQMIRVLISR